MQTISTRLGPARIVESLSELPSVPDAKVIYADVETSTLGKHEEMAVHPYLGDRACGWAITWDDVPGAWYVPIRHTKGNNLPVDRVVEWLRKCFSNPETEWRNANIKFDAHFLKVDGVQFHTRLGCTTTRAKLLNSDRYSHGLKELCRDWLDLPMEEEREVAEFLNALTPGNRKACSDYARVPIDMLGKYACMDVLANRKLEEFILENLPAEQSDLLEQETLLTPVLWDMEHRGLLVDQTKVRIEKLRCLRVLIEAEQKIYDVLGCELRDSNQCMQEIFLVQLGLPVLAWGKSPKDPAKRKQPSFDKDALQLYHGHPRVVSDPKKKDIVDTIIAYKHAKKFLGMYIEPFENLLDSNGRIHPKYNQCVRTGRMSCRDPNSQQMNTAAKRLIIPEEGHAFLSADASQAEFRTICHVIRDDDAIQAFKENPKTDFHQWVADLCHTNRRPAKTMNFLMAFGGGKARATKALISDPTIFAEMQERWEKMLDEKRVRPEDMQDVLEEMCRRRALEVWDAYHTRLPGIRITARRAQNIVKKHGYIKNMYKRRRHLPIEHAHKAFNTYVQSSTADMVKERTVAIADRYNETMREAGILQTANVHDEILMEGPVDAVRDPAVQEYVLQLLSDVQVPHRVKYIWDLGVSDETWGDAKG